MKVKEVVVNDRDDGAPVAGVVGDVEAVVKCADSGRDEDWYGAFAFSARVLAVANHLASRASF